jgi:hypothetical protein
MKKKKQNGDAQTKMITENDENANKLQQWRKGEMQMIALQKKMASP